jgi:hypothetical protein
VAVPLSVLQGLESQFTAVRDGPELVPAGQPVVFHLLQGTPVINVTDVLSAPLDVAWIAKDVRFLNFGPEAALDTVPFQSAALLPLLQGGMPVRVPVVGNLVGTQDLPGVPGLLGQLAGAIPIPVSNPVGVSVHWDVLDAMHNPLAAMQFSAPSGVDSLELTLTFPIQVEELTAAAAVTTVQRFIRATVTLTAGTTAHSFSLPEIPLLLPAIGIPKLVAFFLHTNFAAASGDDSGAVLIVVPTNSPLQSLAQLQPILDSLQATAGTLTSLAEFASLLLGLQILSSALAAQPHVQFRVADSIGNFNDITLISRAWYENDTEAEDELSSLIFLGPPGKVLQCFNDRHLDEGEGWFQLTIGRRVDMVEGAVEVQTPEMFTLIRSLHDNPPVSWPTGGEIDVKKNPDGWNWMLAHSISSFGDELSSMKFV